jgi:hypothetical protein
MHYRPHLKLFRVHEEVILRAVIQASSSCTVSATFTNIQPGISIEALIREPILDFEA